jgi:hypothetical protein
LAQSDVFLSTAIFEGQGIAAVEAMVLAKPVVAMACVGLRECVQDGIDAFLVPPGDEEGAAEAVLRILDDPETAAALGSAAKRNAIERFSSARYARNFLEVVEKAKAFGPPPADAGMVELVGGLLREFERVDRRLSNYDSNVGLGQKLRQILPLLRSR